MLAAAAASDATVTSDGERGPLSGGELNGHLRDREKTAAVGTAVVVAVAYWAS